MSVFWSRNGNQNTECPQVVQLQYGGNFPSWLRRIAIR